MQNLSLRTKVIIFTLSTLIVSLSIGMIVMDAPDTLFSPDHIQASLLHDIEVPE